jgi:hypothetical protein
MKGITMEWESEMKEMEIRVHMVLGDGSFYFKEKEKKPERGICVSSKGDEIGK